MSQLSLIWTFLLKRSRVAFLLALMSLIWGLLAYQSMPRESSPDVEVPIGIISTVWPGASAQDVEKLITEKIEREVKKLDDLEKYTSTSRAGLSIVSVEFQAGGEMVQHMQKLREALDDAERGFPDTIADSPDLIEASANNLPILTLNLSGDFALSELKQFAEALQEDFENVQGVKDVLISGLPEDQFHIYLDPIKLRSFGFSVEEVAQSIQAAHRDIPMGKISVDGETVELRVQGQLKSVEDFFELPLREIDGQIILLSDIAEIRREFDKMDVKTYFSVGQALKPSITLDAIKSEAKTNVARAVEEMLGMVETYKTNGLLPANLQVNEVFNAADDIQKDLNRLIGNGGQTLVLITIILLFALGWREALLAFIAIPLSMLVSIGMLQALGETFNFLSLFALILSVGLLVDNAIIIVEGISENIFYKKQTPVAAAANALVVFRWPIITGTCTTIFAFLPMMFLITGVSGQYIRVIPLTVTIVLTASLLVSLFLVPVFGALFFTLIPPKAHKENSFLLKVKAWYEPRMRKLLNSTKGVYITLGVAGLALLFSLGLMFAGQIPVEIFPGSDENFFTAKIELPKGTKLEATEKLIPLIEDAVLPIYQGNPDYRNMVITVGQVSNFDPSVLRGGGGTPEEEVIGLTFNLQEKKERTIGSGDASREIEKALKQVMPSYAKVTISEFEGGPPSGSSQIEIRLISENLDHLELVTNDLLQKLGAMKLDNGVGLKNVVDNRGDVLPQINWKIDRLKLQKFNLSLNQIAQTLRASVEGLRVLQITEGEDEIDVEMRLDFAGETQWNDPKTLEIIGEIPIKIPSGDYVALEEFTHFEIGPQRSIIRHQDGKRTVTVGADIDGKGTASQFLTQLNQAISLLDKWPGDSFEIGGDNEQGQRLITEMGNAMILAIFLIGMILVLQFNSYVQPLVIVAAIPLSLTAVLVGFWLTQTPISFPTMIGIVALAGIIVNDDIVLIDQINHHHTGKFVDALIDGCMARMQPIALTSITTVIGMLPLALSDPIWQGLGFAIIYGMALSTVLTLLLTPCILLVLKQWSNWAIRKIKRSGEETRASPRVRPYGSNNPIHCHTKLALLLGHRGPWFLRHR
ncbi:MAG TPA: efflux RND transporter permease subunit [Candidatus Gracilibacteria bacterium]